MLPLRLRLRLLVGLFLVAVTTISLGVFLYFGRIQHYSSWFFQSDFVVFGTPAVAGFGGFFYVIWRSLPPEDAFNWKLVTCLVWAFCAFFLCMFITGFISFNSWGS